MFDHTDPTELPKARPVIGWPGGKTRMLKHILPLIPDHTCYCEVFFGGGAVFFGKPPSHHEVINDINNDLTGFMRCAKYHLDAVLDEMDLVLNSRRDFEDFLAQPGLTDIQRAARWFLANKLSFGGMGKTFAVTRTHPLTSRAQRLIAIRALSRRLDKTTIENRDWSYVLKYYDSSETFFFMDPPYLDGAGPAYAGWSEHDVSRFAAAVRGLKGAWMVTFQDCPQIREAFAGFTVQAITRANGIGNTTGKKGRTYKEVIIASERAAGTVARKKGVAG